MNFNGSPITIKARQSKGGLARLMATENISIEHDLEILGASFNLGTRVLKLPVWKDASETLYNLMTGHEIGHALFTKAFASLEKTDKYYKEAYTKIEPDEKQHSFVQSICNIVEDARIEKLVKRRYPGMKHEFHDGYYEMLNRDYFQISKRKIEETLFADKFNVLFKTGMTLGGKFNSQEESFIARGEKLETMDEVFLLSKDIYEYTKNEMKEKGLDQKTYKTTEQILVEMLQGLCNPNPRGRATNVNIPNKFNVKEYIIPVDEIIAAYAKIGNHLDNGAVLEYLNKNNFVINYMTKEFEMRKAAEEYKKIYLDKTGMLNTNKLQKYKFAEDIFKRNTVIPTGKNHGMIMFLDLSSSMRDKIAYTIEQLIVLVRFCKKINIPFEVYGFTDNSINTNMTTLVRYNENPKSFTEGDLKLSSAFRLKQYLTSSMPANVFAKALGCLFVLAECHSKNDGGFRLPPSEILSGTPLNETIICARQISKNFIEKYRCEILNVIFLTDGASNGITHITQKNKEDTNSLREADIIHDPDTHKIYGGYGKFSVTDKLLMALKDYTGGNILGYFLTSSYVSMHTYGNYLTIPAETEKEKEKFNKEGFVVEKMLGYDEFYIVKVVKNQDETNKTPKNINHFFDTAIKRINNKILLQKFIDSISTEKLKDSVKKKRKHMVIA